MTNIKLLTFEKLLLLAVLIGSIYGFWYFEESVILRIFILMIAALGLFSAFKKTKQEHFASKFELLSLLIMYLGIFTIYNILYSINLPLYICMIIVLVLVVALLYSMLSLDNIGNLLPKEVFRGLILLLGLVILEIFLGLYFLPIDPAAKSLSLVVVFYLINSLIYLYIYSMLRLKKILGYLIVSVVILIVVFLVTWLKIPK